MRPYYRRFRALLACCIVLSAIVALPLASPSPVAAGTAYTITDLGSLRPDNSGHSHASSINNTEQIVGGAVYGAEPNWHAFVREPVGTMRDLGSLHPLNLGGSSANAINSAGAAVGESSFGDELGHAILWQPLPGGAFSKRDLGTLGSDDSERSSAFALNDSGQVVGFSSFGSSGPYAVLWQIADDGAITRINLGTLLDYNVGASFAWGINNAGFIVGDAYSFHGTTAMRWEVDSAGKVTALDLGAATGSISSTANAINESGLIAGVRMIREGNDSQGTLWRVGEENQVSYIPLPALLEGRGGISTTTAINNQGFVVGSSSLVPYGSYNPENFHAVVWTVNSDDTAIVTDLNSLIPSDSGWELLAAADINDAGQIVGTGRRNGEDRAFLLTPVEGNTLALTTRNSATGRLDARTIGAVAVTPTPAPGPYATGTVITLTAQPKANGIFTGWVVDGTFRGWATTLRLAIAGDHTVQANFGPRTDFTDVREDDPAREGIEQLAAHGIVFGYGTFGCHPPLTYPCFGPDDPVQRAQLPVMVVRALGWQDEPQGELPFSDLGNTEESMQRAIRILATKGVVAGYGDGRFGPNDEVSRAQAISIIARAMVKAGYWEPVTVDNPALYPNIPADSPHRLDILTYAARVGEVPYDPPTGNWPEWLLPGSRAWTAQALWQALDSTFGP